MALSSSSLGGGVLFRVPGWADRTTPFVLRYGVVLAGLACNALSQTDRDDASFVGITQAFDPRLDADEHLADRARTPLPPGFAGVGCVQFGSKRVCVGTAMI